MKDNHTENRTEKTCRVEIITRKGKTKLLINDTDLSDFATGLSLEIQACMTPKIHIDLLATDVSVDTDEAEVSTCPIEEGKD